MKYVGSKNRLAKDLAPIIQSYIDDNNITHYWEPFVGGGNMIDKIHCEHKFGSDIHPYLIALLKQAQTDTSVFPTTISEKEYKTVRENPQNYPDWYVGLVGFCSFGAMWFGGYPRGFKNDGITPRNMPNEAIRNLIRQAPKLKDIKFECKSFEDCNNVKSFVIYCDIPYKDTTKYAVADFPYEKFYSWCKKMSQNNIVLISEYSMPDDFECIWSKELKCILNNKKAKNIDRVERLFKVK